MDLHASLKANFGFDRFRPGQLEACTAALADRDVLVVMPTGSGKSLCYQLPALMRDDLTVVVSPLVALMQDQVDALNAGGHGDSVALVNAQQDTAANAAVIERALAGELRLLYVAPERFSSPGFVARMEQVRVGLFVVDEAHCVSQWGHDFRPDYFRLADAARHVGAAAIVASTATATPRVALDIARRLGLREALRVSTGFDRPNVSFAVVRPAPHEKQPLITEALRRPDSLPAIVYSGTRAGAEEIAESLTRDLGEEAAAYHAGLDRQTRSSVQRRFLADDVRVIVATNAFGMGVDKPNVRTVVHAGTPSSLEAYYQEAGRAGRDGLPARALLLAENRDKALHVHFIKREEVDPELPAALAARLIAAADGDGRYALDARGARAAGGRRQRPPARIARAPRSGAGHPALAVVARPRGRPAVRAGLRPEGGRGLPCLGGGRRALALAPVPGDLGVRGEETDCRRRAILRHFGDNADPAERPDGAACCDVCDGGLAPELPPPSLEAVADLDDAIVSVARSARPAVGRTTCAEIIHGARTKKIERNSYNGLPAYGTSAQMRRADILARVDELIEAGVIRTSGGPYPVLQAA